MDNFMQSYAAFIALDKETVADCIITGNPINRQLGNDEKKLTDMYLKMRLSEIDN